MNSACCRSQRSAPKVQSRFTETIKAMIVENPSFGYRTVGHLLSFNKNTVERIFQLKGWQVKKRSVGFRARIEILLLVAMLPNKRWSTDYPGYGQGATVGPCWLW